MAGSQARRVFIAGQPARRTMGWASTQRQRQPVYATQLDETLVFGDRPFVWKELDAAVRQYILGFDAEDLDGNTAATVFTQVLVE